MFDTSHITLEGDQSTKTTTMVGGGGAKGTIAFPSNQKKQKTEFYKTSQNIKNYTAKQIFIINIFAYRTTQYNNSEIRVVAYKKILLCLQNYINN